MGKESKYRNLRGVSGSQTGNAKVLGRGRSSLSGRNKKTKGLRIWGYRRGLRKSNSPLGDLAGRDSLLCTERSLIDLEKEKGLKIQEGGGTCVLFLTKRFKAVSRLWQSHRIEEGSKKKTQ